MSAPNLTKGRLIQISSGIIIPFMFNPTELETSHGWSWGQKGIPGRSHPMYQGGEGAGESITFTLYFDGDRGRMDFRRSQAASPAPGVNANVMPEINQLRALVKPHDRNYNGAYGPPDLCILDMGAAFSARVGVDSVNVGITEWLSDLGVLRATVDISCHIDEEFNSSDWLFTSSEVSNYLTNNPQIAPHPQE